MLSLFISVLVLLFGVATGLTREYIFVQTAMTWTDAQTYCQKNYKDLATITCEEENRRVLELLGSTADAWIGMYRGQINADVWLWSDGTPSSFTHWVSPQPNNRYGIQNCVEIMPDTWNDLECYEKLVFICQRPVVLVNMKKTWEEASNYCRMHYTSLASPATEPRVQLAEMASNQTQTDSVWTGLRFLNGNWFWLSGEPLGNFVLLPSCPAPNYRCGARNTKTHRWENKDCNEKLNFLCYY